MVTSSFNEVVSHHNLVFTPTESNLLRFTDARTLNSIELSGNAVAQPDGDWDLSHSELMTFGNPAFDSPPH